MYPTATPVTAMPPNAASAAALATSLVDAIRDNRLDEAEQLLEELIAVLPEAEELLVFPVLIAIQRGQVLEALQYLNGLPEDRAPELRALCLNVLGDPTWHAVAEASLASDDPSVRDAMRDLLGLTNDAEAHA